LGKKEVSGSFAEIAAWARIALALIGGHAGEI